MFWLASAGMRSGEGIGCTLCVARMGGWEFEPRCAKDGADDVVCTELFGYIRVLDMCWGGSLVVGQGRHVHLKQGRLLFDSGSF